MKTNQIRPYWFPRKHTASEEQLTSLIVILQVVYAALSIPENRGESLVTTEDKMSGGQEKGEQPAHWSGAVMQGHGRARLGTGEGPALDRTISVTTC